MMQNYDHKNYRNFIDLRDLREITAIYGFYKTNFGADLFFSIYRNFRYLQQFEKKCCKKITRNVVKKITWFSGNSAKMELQQFGGITGIRAIYNFHFFSKICLTTV